MLGITSFSSGEDNRNPVPCGKNRPGGRSMHSHTHSHVPDSSLVNTGIYKLLNGKQVTTLKINAYLFKVS